jgi:hypothetical protein
MLVFAKPTTMVVDFAVVTRIYLGVVPTTFWLNGPYLPLIWPLSSTMMWALTDGEWLLAIKAVMMGICDSSTHDSTTRNNQQKVWAILQTSYQHGQGLQESLSCHNQTLKAIAILANI